MAKALGYSAEQVNRLAKQLGTWRYDTSRGDPKSLSTELSAAGFDPEESRIRLFAEMWRKIQNLPRHLGQHSGGMVMCDRPIVEVCPVEWSSFTGRPNASLKSLDGQPIRIEVPTDRTRGKYGRLLAYIYLPDGRLFNALLIETGHGYADPRFRHPKMR